MRRPSGYALAGLSKARVRHLFVEQTRLPFRTHLPHFSRTFRRMFDTAAAELDVD
jgi:hypothetical protein